MPTSLPLTLEDVHHQYHLVQTDAQNVLQRCPDYVWGPLSCVQALGGLSSDAHEVGVFIDHATASPTAALTALHSAADALASVASQAAYKQNSGSPRGVEDIGPLWQQVEAAATAVWGAAT